MIWYSTYYPFFGGSLKKRLRPYLINHYKYSVNEEPEKYYYSLLLLFKPWRDSETLTGDCESFTVAFETFKDELVDVKQHHNRLQQYQEKDNTVRIQILERHSELESEEKNTDTVEETLDPLLHGVSDAQEAMRDFEAALIDNDNTDVDTMIDNLNDKKIIQEQCQSSETNSTEPLRMFVSGCGGTGKSYYDHQSMGLFINGETSCSHCPNRNSCIQHQWFNHTSVTTVTRRTRQNSTISSIIR